MPELAHRNQMILIFPSALGWIAVIHTDRVLRRLSFGHRNPQKAAAALPPSPKRQALPDAWERRLIARFQAYADGRREQFEDLALGIQSQGNFLRKVYDNCRRVPYGQTVTYGQLAILAGSPRAARAVGNCMARNPLPLVIPCHRVVPASGGLGGYSAPGATRLKARLLELEGARLPELA